MWTETKDYNQLAKIIIWNATNFFKDFGLTRTAIFQPRVFLFEGASIKRLKTTGLEYPNLYSVFFEMSSIEMCLASSHMSYGQS